jgi:hypothetical protein
MGGENLKWLSKSRVTGAVKIVLTSSEKHHFYQTVFLQEGNIVMYVDHLVKQYLYDTCH